MINKTVQRIAILGCLLCGIPGFGQEDEKPSFSNYNLEYLMRFDEGRLLSQMDSFHSSIRPYRASEVIQYINPDSVLENYAYIDDLKYFQRKLLLDPFFTYQDRYKTYQIVINPLMDFSFGKDDLGDRSLFTNTRGIQVMGQLGKQIRFYSDLRENEARVPEYIQNWVSDRNRVLPAEGQATALDDEGKYDYGWASGWVQYKSKKFFTFEMGQGKHFIGDGYRSLLLSDVAFNYPYFKITTDIGKIRYVNLYMEHRDIYEWDNLDEPHWRKYNVSHYLTANITKRFSFGFFESVVWDGETNNRGVEFGYMNPVILLRTVERSVGSANGNVLWGFNGKYLLNEKTTAYGQFVMDELRLDELFASNNWWGNKYGFQLGVKTYDFLEIKGLNLQAEVNFVRPFTYSHQNRADADAPETEGGLMNYGHYNQSLAHPLGANFMEYILKANYTHKRMHFKGKIIVAKKGFDFEDGISYGGDIYVNYDNRNADAGIEMFQGNETNITYLEGKAGYLINPQTNLVAEIGIAFRDQKPTYLNMGVEERQDMIFSFGLKTDLFNRYYDF